MLASQHSTTHNHNSVVSCVICCYAKKKNLLCHFFLLLSLTYSPLLFVDVAECTTYSWLIWKTTGGSTIPPIFTSITFKLVTLRHDLVKLCTPSELDWILHDPLIIIFFVLPFHHPFIVGIQSVWRLWVQSIHTRTYIYASIFTQSYIFVVFTSVDRSEWKAFDALAQTHIHRHDGRTPK